MPKYYHVYLLIILFPTLLFSQKSYKSDTLIYQKQGEPYRLIPQWTVGRTDTFNVSLIDMTIDNGDTIANKRLSSRIIHQVQKVTDTAIFQIAKIGKEIYQKQVFYKNAIPDNPRIKDFFEVEYQTDRRGINIKITNCSELQNHLIPDLEESIESLKRQGENIVYSISDYPKKMKDCNIVQSFLTNDLVMFHQLFNQLVPHKGILKYQIKQIDTVDTKIEMSMYLQTQVVSKENGNLVFEITEDRTKGATVFETLTTDLANSLKKEDDNWGKDSEDEEFNNDNNTVIEVDNFNYPVKIVRRIVSTEKTKTDVVFDFYEYKIEKIGY